MSETTTVLRLHLRELECLREAELGETLTSAILLIKIDDAIARVTPARPDPDPVHGDSGKVCEPCLEAAEEDGAEEDIAEWVCLTIGADISDHTCSDKATCECSCHKRGS